MKATVHYDISKPFYKAGESFFCHPLDHTSPFVSNTRLVQTSRVVKVHKDGTIETENSLYIPQQPRP